MNEINKLLQLVLNEPTNEKRNRKLFDLINEHEAKKQTYKNYKP